MVGFLAVLNGFFDNSRFFSPIRAFIKNPPIKMVIISNGFNKFHLSVAAAEMEKRGWLSISINGAYPTPLIRTLAVQFQLNKIAKINRLLDRREQVQDFRVHPLWVPECIDFGRYLLEKFGFIRIAERFKSISYRLYGYLARRAVKAADSRVRIYHYRAGFGGESVATAKRLGMIALCDHSIVHPSVLSYLVSNGGRMPPKGTFGPISNFWSNVLVDINQADAVLVNSDFVKHSFVHQGWDANLVHTIYLGVDDQFLQFMPSQERVACSPSSALRLLFAGTFERRKGAEDLIEALQKVKSDKWRIEIVGRVDPEIRRHHASFFMDPRVKCFGVLPRAMLAQRMAVAEVFVFPSLAEGSARVVFEALSAGCYVITTPNSGSVVKDREHGALVPPNDADSLAKAIQQAIHQRSRLAEISVKNANLVRSYYRQEHYGDKLIHLYKQLLLSHAMGLTGPVN